MAMRKRRANGGVNKSEWIRGQPKSLSAKEVVEKAKGAGIELSLAQVYTARSTAKKSSNGSSPLPTKSALRPGRPKAAAASILKEQYLALVVRIGTQTAADLLRTLQLPY
jgi:hypothetical protein